MSLPDKMKEEVGYLIKGVSDHRHEELTPDMIYQVFTGNYVNIKDVFDVAECYFRAERRHCRKCDDPSRTVSAE